MFNKIYKSIKMRLAYRNTKSYTNYLRKNGVSIGKGLVISGRISDREIDLTRPSLVTIGDNVSINRHFILMTHDFVSGVFLNKFSDFIPSSGAVTIGNNVRFGANCTVLKGVTIGDNCFIGAGSIVSNDIPDNSVANGNPCKVVCSIDTFYKMRQEACKPEAYLYAQSIVKRFGRQPVPADFREEFPLFVDSSNIDKYPEIPVKHQLQSAYDTWLENHVAPFRSFDEFLETALTYDPANSLFRETPESASNLVFHTVDEYKRVFCRAFNIDISNVENCEYKQTEGWDSVGHMTLIAELEQAFGIEMKPEDFFQLHSYVQGIRILRLYGIGVGSEEKEELSFSEDFFDFSSYQDNIAVQTEYDSYTYRDLEVASDEIGQMLQKGKVAFLLAKNTIGSVACYTGCIKNNVPVAVLDAHKDAEFISGIIEQYHPEYLVLPSEDVDKFPGEVIGTQYDYIIKHLETTGYPVDENLALLLTTSGSTGSPKFVRLTTKNIQSNAESIANYLDLNQFERPITSLPMYYSYGISIINSHFAVGATIVLTEKSVIDPAFWTLAKKQNATSVSGVPYTYEMFRQSRVMDMDLPSIKTFTQAGGKMSKDDVAFFAEKCKQKGRKLIVMYGQTEASPRISYLPFDKAVEKSDSIGIPIPGVKLSVSEDGELVCEGPNVFQGYAESFTDLNKGDEHSGILFTGDMARQDSDGYFYITGRKKRFVKVYGNRVGLDELEQLIMPVFGKVVCVGVDDHVTVYTEDKELPDTELVTYISEKTKINQQAFKVCHVDAFPYSETGKIKYKELKVIM